VILGLREGNSVKSGDKLQKLLILLVTWGLLVVFFAGYEIYFVRGQEQFLQANGFRSLASLAKELTAKVTKARASTESLVRFVNEKTRDPQEIHAYLRLYLDSPTIAGTEQDLRTCAPITGFGNRTHVPLSFIPRENALMLTVSCFERNSDDTRAPGRPILLYAVDRFTDAFQEQTDDFDDVLIADESGRVFLEESNRGLRIANLKAFMSESDDSAQPTEGKNKKKAAKDKQASADSFSSIQALFLLKSWATSEAASSVANACDWRGEV
jgi:hypothetical protein